jgi:hypothetical protein
MQQELFSKSDNLSKQDNKISLGAGLEIEIFKGFKPKAILYRHDAVLKLLDLSDKTAMRLFIVETVELGAIRGKLADALGICRQSIYNYIEIKKEFGSEGLVNNYRPDNSKSRATQRKRNKNKILKGNKARILEEIRREKRADKENNTRQLSLFSYDVEGHRNITTDDQPFAEIHDWNTSRYAGIFLYLICLISDVRWLEFVSGYFGNAYKIFMVFILMVGRNIPSIEQLKNVHAREAGRILGLKKLPSRPILWEWFYSAADMKQSTSLLYDYFRQQIRIGTVGTWVWFIDGHLLPYSGKEKVHYSYNTQRRLPMPGRTNLVTCDISGRIVDFEIQEGKGNLREYITKLQNKWLLELSGNPLMVFDREGYGGDFFYGLIQGGVHFVTWDKYVDSAKLSKLDNELFCDEITVNGKKYNLFEGNKQFTCKLVTGNQGETKRHQFDVRRIYIWNRSCNRRTCVLAWTGDTEISATDCARVILNRWGASENTFKHLNDRHPFHYHPGFKVKESTKQEIVNPVIKEKQSIINSLQTQLNRLYKRFSRAKDILNKDGNIRKNSAKERIKAEIDSIESDFIAIKKEKKELPEKVDASTLEDYRSFKEIDNEGKNLFDFVTSSVWNARKQMVSWLSEFYNCENEVVDLFYAITNCHGWVKSTQNEVRVRLEPIQQPKRRAAQEQLCRKLTSLGARLPTGKWLVVEVGNSPTQKTSKK